MLELILEVGHKLRDMSGTTNQRVAVTDAGVFGTGRPQGDGRG